MGKVLLAFAAGVALTSLAFALFDGAQSQGVVSVGPLDPDEVPDTETSIEARAAADEAPEARSSVADSDEAEFPESLARFAQRDWTRDAARDLLSTWTDEELRSMERRASELIESIDETERVMDLVRSELLRREAVAMWAAEPPPDVPISLPSEFNYLSEFPLRFHEELQRDPIDTEWSPRMEAQLQNFLVSRSEITSTYGFPTINCRASGCEIAFASYALNSERAQQLISFDLPAALGGIYEQPWAAQIERVNDDLNRPMLNIQARFQDNGPQTFLVYIGRAGTDLSGSSPR